MLIEFRVENYRSLRDEQVLTMEAARVGDPSDPRPRAVPGHGKKLLPAAVLYGANASGKSNVLDALGFMRDAVDYSHFLWKPDGGVPRKPFAWGKKRKQPSMFEASILIDGNKYAYGFVLNDRAVEEEWLFAWPNNRKQVWFERDRGKYKFGEQLKGRNESFKKVTRPNALFLSVASQHGHRQLFPIFSWFRDIATVNIRGIKQERPFPIFEAPYLYPDDEVSEKSLERIQQLLHIADTGIVGLKTAENGGPAANGPLRVVFQHQAKNDKAWLDYDDESEGTKTLLQMALRIFRTLERGRLFLIDELDSSLHPLLAVEIVRMFNNPESNPNNAQIVFTTHDTNLLATTLDGELLRRDQIWFTEKDKDGATILYPLTDYKPRKSENLERGYLQGRYGAIPFLGDIASIVE